jgi:hypothetical protein
MSPLEAGQKANRAIAMAEAIYVVLGALYALPENGPGSRVAQPMLHRNITIHVSY